MSGLALSAEPRRKAKKARDASKARARCERSGRPFHTWKFGQFSDEWFNACNEAFVEAMLANPSERP